MANFFLDNDDLRFYFEKGLAWGPLYELTERALGGGCAAGEAPFKDAAEAAQFYGEIAQAIGELAADEVAPRAADIDREGARFEDGEALDPPAFADIFEKIRELDLHRMCLPRDLGGTNAPLLLYFVSSELLARGDVSVMAHMSFHGGIAMALLVFSILEGTTKFDIERRKLLETRFGKAIEEIASGEAWGCMDITEPDAGSDMAALRASAEQDEKGRWRLTGEKIFVTSGHGKYHFVIARTEKAQDGDDPFAGLSGLSLFLVKTYEDGKDGKRVRFATLDRIEEKLGHHGSVTATLTFDRTPAELVGKRGEGFKYMLTLMNNARLGVGFESIGLCEAAHRLARDYAAGRPSMGKTIDRHEIVADYLDEMRTDIQGLRALAMWGAVEQELGEKLSILLKLAPPASDAERKRLEREASRHKASARRGTPLLKYLAAEKAVELARRCVQIHGGNGYMREYGAEKLLRDAVVMPIYEGTSQIQALMAMKDTLAGILKDVPGFVRRAAQARWRSLSARDPLERRVARIQALSLGAQRHLMTRTATDKVRSLRAQPVARWPAALLENWDPKRDFGYALLHAERLTRLLADEAICEALLDQARAHPERREVLERYLERAEPRCRALVDEITTTGDRLLGALAGNAAPVGAKVAPAAEPKAEHAGAAV